LPLSYQGEQLGQLILAPRAPGESFTPAEWQLLTDLAHQAGVAAAAVRLTADLQRSRERLVTAREEERRRLRRDLHDGLGPQLASHVLKLEAARELVRSNPERVEEILNNLIEKSQGIVNEVRRLVYALRPPALDELGLLGAIREYAAQSSDNDLQITVVAPERCPPLPAAVEVAAYRIVQEAVTNVIRHAQAQNCSIKLTVIPASSPPTDPLPNPPPARGREGWGSVAGVLQVDISDDGQGLPPNYRAGVGLNSMRERAEELGGECLVETLATGGTRVLAQLPLPQE
jgi:signal transduction histidine kinase